VAAGAVGHAAQLRHLRRAPGPAVEPLSGKHHHPVDVGGDGVDLFGAAVGQEDGRAAEERRLDLERLGKPSVVERRGGQVLGGSGSLDDEKRGVVLADDTPGLDEQPVEGALVQGFKEVGVVTPLADEGRVEERELAQVGEHPAVALGQDGGEDRLPPPAA
jgi:hypothetical protein